MDLRNLDTRERAHEGVDVPLVIEGETQMGLDGEPITFRLKGIADPAVKRVATTAYKGAKAIEDFEAANRKVALAAVIGWSGNWTLDGEEGVPFSKDALAKVLEIPDIANALAMEVTKSANFMKKP